MARRIGVCGISVSPAAGTARRHPGGATVPGRSPVPARRRGGRAACPAARRSLQALDVAPHDPAVRPRPRYRRPGRCRFSSAILRTRGLAKTRDRRTAANRLPVRRRRGRRRRPPPPAPARPAASAATAVPPSAASMSASVSPSRDQHRHRRADLARCRRPRAPAGRRSRTPPPGTRRAPSRSRSPPSGPRRPRVSPGPTSQFAMAASVASASTLGIRTTEAISRSPPLRNDLPIRPHPLQPATTSSVRAIAARSSTREIDGLASPPVTRCTGWSSQSKKRRWISSASQPPYDVPTAPCSTISTAFVFLICRPTVSQSSEARSRKRRSMSSASIPVSSIAARAWETIDRYVEHRDVVPRHAARRPSRRDLVVEVVDRDLALDCRTGPRARR